MSELFRRDGEKQDALGWDDVDEDWPACKNDNCGDPAITLLHGRFPFCRQHYREVIES